MNHLSKNKGYSALEFRELVGKWQGQLERVGVTLPDGKPLPDKFFHVFLGIGYSTFKAALTEQKSNKGISKQMGKTIRFLSKLPFPVFIEEARLAVKEYTEKYN